MDKDFEKKYHLIEQTQWWFTGRREAIHRLLKNMNKARSVLDIGCSGGLLIQELAAKYPHLDIYGIDVSEEAINQCRAAGLKNIFQMDATNPDLPKNYFDLIISSDCLEHIENDSLALNNWFKLLSPGGSLLLFVPAFKQLWGPHDVINHHFRRYTSGELNHKIKQTGFEIQQSGYWNIALFFPALIGRSLKRMFNTGTEKADNLVNPPEWLNALLKGWLHLENKLLGKLRFPFGISTWCLAIKQKTN